MEEVFEDVDHITLVCYDHSSQQSATDQFGRKPKEFVSSITQHLSSYHLPNSSYLTTNIDADDLVSPLHSLLLFKAFILLTNQRPEAADGTYLCFPNGSQISALHDKFYGYTGTSNCFMSTISKHSSCLPHVWITGHDSLDTRIPYYNIPTWNSMWSEVLWGSNLTNKVWHSSILSSPEDCSMTRALFESQRMLLRSVMVD